MSDKNLEIFELKNQVGILKDQVIELKKINDSLMNVGYMVMWDGEDDSVYLHQVFHSKNEAFDFAKRLVNESCTGVLFVCRHKLPNGDFKNSGSIYVNKKMTLTDALKEMRS